MSKKTIKSILLWLSRVIGFAALYYLVALYVGEGLQEMVDTDDALDLEFMLITFYLLLCIIGFIVSFFCRRTGGMLMIIPALLLSIYIILNGYFESFVIFTLPFIICGGTAVIIKRDKKKRID